MDNHKINVLEQRDTVLIGICEHLDIWLPRFCYHSELSIAGNCRMCLVETSVSPKPVVACATSINNDLEIKTNTLLIKKIRENILEFLLINHPLDCPICDQGGECDLQDLVIIFGSDRGRFIESKRSVLDKNFGPMIKTIMTRCIHCTRCIRFSSELIGIPYLGAFGRGDSTEIGTYINRQLGSYLTGNLIDICPVGAITSKPYAFRARSWELNSIETIDILDSLCSSIRVDTKNNLVYRILPAINTLVNECWISDKIRFSYDSVTNQRLLNPLILSDDFDLVGHSWEYAFHKLRLLFTNKIDLFSNYSNFYLLTGDLLDLFSYYSSVYIFWMLGIDNININSYKQLTKQNDFRNNYIFNIPLYKIQNFNLFLFTNVSLDKEFPLICLRLRKLKLLNKKKIFFYLGNSFDFFLNDLYHLGISDTISLGIFYGKFFFCTILEKQMYLYILNGLNNSKNQVSDCIFYKSLSDLLKIQIEYNYLSLFSSEIHKREFGLFTKLELLNSFSKLERPYLLYLVGFDSKLDIDIKETSNLEIIYQGSHGTMNTDNSKLIIPTSLFLEKSSNFLNCEGRVLRSTSVLEPLGESWSDELVFYAITKYMSFESLSYTNWYDMYFLRVPFINKNGILVSKTFFNLLNYLAIINFAYVTKYSHFLFTRVHNYYQMDTLSIFSKNILNCVKKNYTIKKSIGNFII